MTVYAGQDPVTGKRSYLRETVEGTDAQARKKAQRLLTKLHAEVDRQKAPTSSVPFSHVLDEWLATSEIEESTRKGYVGYIKRTIRPALGEVAVDAITSQALERFYVQLRRCRQRCPAVTGARGESNPETTEHHCVPLSASTVRQVHAVISGSLDAAVRWEWIAGNPARLARKPRQKPAQPDPPSARDASRLSNAAFEMDDDWGTLVWLLMTTGMRRGELVGLRFDRVDLEDKMLDIRRNWVDGRDKDTKTHQMRRIALDETTTALLAAQRVRAEERAAATGQTFSEHMFVFTGLRALTHVEPYSPNAISQRYKDMAARLGIDTHLHSLRHYSATELLSAGVDLRTVAGRLGHSGGGATTLRVYAAWNAGADRLAADTLARRMPALARHSVPQG